MWQKAVGEAAASRSITLKCHWFFGRSDNSPSGRVSVLENGGERRPLRVSVATLKSHANCKKGVLRTPGTRWLSGCITSALSLSWCPSSVLMVVVTQLCVTPVSEGELARKWCSFQGHWAEQNMRKGNQTKNQWHSVCILSSDYGKRRNIVFLCLIKFIIICHESFLCVFDVCVGLWCWIIYVFVY